MGIYLHQMSSAFSKVKQLCIMMWHNSHSRDWWWRNTNVLNVMLAGNRWSTMRPDWRNSQTTLILQATHLNDFHKNHFFGGDKVVVAGQITHRFRLIVTAKHVAHVHLTWLACVGKVSFLTQTAECVTRQDACHTNTLNKYPNWIDKQSLDVL